MEKKKKKAVCLFGLPHNVSHTSGDNGKEIINFYSKKYRYCKRKSGILNPS